MVLFALGVCISLWQFFFGPFADLGWTADSWEPGKELSAVTVEMWVSLVLCALTVPITAALVELEQRRREHILGSGEQD